MAEGISLDEIIDLARKAKWEKVELGHFNSYRGGFANFSIDMRVKTTSLKGLGSTVGRSDLDLLYDVEVDCCLTTSYSKTLGEATLGVGAFETQERVPIGKKIYEDTEFPTELDSIRLKKFRKIEQIAIANIERQRQETLPLALAQFRVAMRDYQI